MYCSPWPRGCTWELAVLKDSEAKQSCYLLRSAPLGSFSPVLLPSPPTAQAAGLGRLPTPQPRGLSSSPDRVEGPPVPGLSQRCCLCLAPSTTRVSALAAPRARSTTRAARSRCPVPTGSAPGLYGSPPQTEPQPASGGCARYSGSSRHRASHGPRGSEGRLQSSLLAAWKVLEMGPTSRARMLPHQGGPGSRGAGLTLARRARRCPGATRGAG